jgi:hypothetical protein
MPAKSKMASQRVAIVGIGCANLFKMPSVSCVNLRPYYALLAAAPTISVGWLLMALVDPDAGAGQGEYVGLGYLFGTMFAHTTLAAGWLAFGPTPLLLRLPGSAAWVAALLCALAINLKRYGGPGEVATLMACCLLAQWFVVQLPLWMLAIGYGLRLQHRDHSSRIPGPCDRQFGIRQVMTLTAIVAILLGIGRLVLPPLAESLNVEGEAPIFIFLGVAAIVVTVPLLLAALVPHRTLLTVVGVMTILAVATALELPLLNAVHSLRGGPNLGHFIGINAFTAAWILGVVGIFRFGGYGLALRSDRPSKTGSP